MKFYIIYGDDIDRIFERQSYFKNYAKENKWDIEYIQVDKNINLGIKNEYLFKKGRLLICDLSKDVLFLKQIDPNIFDKEEGIFLVFCNKKIRKDQLLKYSSIAKIEEYNLPVILWKFMESIYPNNSKYIISTFHKLLEKESAEKIFYLLSNHFRDLYLSAEDVNEINMPIWRLSKLRHQASKFKNNNLKEIIKDLSKIDIDVKTSKANLVDSLDFLFISKLEWIIIYESKSLYF